MNTVIQLSVLRIFIGFFAMRGKFPNEYTKDLSNACLPDFATFKLYYGSNGDNESCIAVDAISLTTQGLSFVCLIQRPRKLLSYNKHM